jgi:hypothetical protein
VESVVGSCAGQPGSVGLSGGRTVGARRAIVVATDAPAARQLLGDALEASPSKTEPGVGTCNLYFRWGLSRPQIFFLGFKRALTPNVSSCHARTQFPEVILCPVSGVLFVAAMVLGNVGVGS